MDDSNLERSRVKVQSILMREKDLALALQTPFLRIEAPIPGEALVGLEVPSPSPSKVHLREVMANPTFGLLAAKNGLPMAIGQDTGGSPVAMDLTSLPHILIAGATGSGKSVCINSIIATLLLTKPPDQLRFLMVDPKRVELTPFNGIPHLMAPVIVDVDEVNAALRGLMREMLRRYKRMEDIGVRNITSYNSKTPERWPYLVSGGRRVGRPDDSRGLRGRAKPGSFGPTGPCHRYSLGPCHAAAVRQRGNRLAQGQHSGPGSFCCGITSGLPGHFGYHWSRETLRQGRHAAFA